MGANGPYMSGFLGNYVSIFVEIFKNNQKNHIFCSEKLFFVQKKIIFFDQIFLKFISWSRRIILKQFPIDSDSLNAI